MAKKDLTKRALTKFFMKNKVLYGNSIWINSIMLNLIHRNKLVIRPIKMILRRLLILIILCETILIKYFFQLLVTAIMDWSHSFFILFNLTFLIQQKDNYLLMFVLSCEVQSCISIIITSIRVNFIMKKHLYNFYMACQRSNV